MKLYLFFLAALLGTAVHAQKLTADDLVGNWFTRDSKAKIMIYKNGGKYNGRIVWLKVPLRNGKPKVDEKNPDPSLRNQPIIGLELIRGFSFDGDNVWEDGTVYDPEGGKEYSCKITMVNRNTIKVRGYIGISLLGRTEVWTRTQ